jgi:hypothetical protein
VPARTSFEEKIKLRNGTKMPKIPLRDEATWADKAPWAGEAAETHEAGGEYSRQLYDYVQQSLDREESFHFLSSEMLQRLNIANLQYKLAEIKDSGRGWTIPV